MNVVPVVVNDALVVQARQHIQFHEDLASLDVWVGRAFLNRHLVVVVDAMRHSQCISNTPNTPFRTLPLPGVASECNSSRGCSACNLQLTSVLNRRLSFLDINGRMKEERVKKRRAFGEHCDEVLDEQLQSALLSLNEEQRRNEIRGPGLHQRRHNPVVAPVDVLELGVDENGYTIPHFFFTYSDRRRDKRRDIS